MGWRKQKGKIKSTRPIMMHADWTYMARAHWNFFWKGHWIGLTLNYALMYFTSLAFAICCFLHFVYTAMIFILFLRRAAAIRRISAILSWVVRMPASGLISYFCRFITLRFVRGNDQVAQISLSLFKTSLALQLVELAHGAMNCNEWRKTFGRYHYYLY